MTHTTLTLTPSSWPPLSHSKQITAGAEKQKLVPTPLGESALQFCLREFPQLFAYEFTAQMEDRLDSVAKGEDDWKNVCRDTWASYKEKYELLGDKKTLPTSSDKVKEFGGGLKAVMSKSGPLLVQEVEGATSKAKGSKDKPPATFYSFPQGATISTLTEEMARAHIASLLKEDVLGEWNGEKILKKKGPYGLYAQCGELRVPFLEDEPLQKVYEKLRAKKETADNKTRIGGYVFSTGPYGPYMYKDGLKTKNFVKIPSTTDPKTMSLADAEALYKQCSEAKKAAGGARGGWNKGGKRGGK